MAASKVATIGCSFEGDCSKHYHGHFTGTFSQDGSIVISLNGKPVCVTGTAGKASCGCWVQAVGQSASIALNGKPVARVGDPIVEAGSISYSTDEDGNVTASVSGGGSITGTITSGVDFLAID